MATILENDAGVTETVERSRGLKLRPTELPRVLVYTRGDRRVGDEPRSLNPMRLLRETTVVVECVTDWSKSASSKLDDELEDMQERVEAALAEAQADSLGNTVQRFLYRETQDAFTEGEGSVRMASRVILFDAQYDSEMAASLPDLATIGIDYHRGAPGDFAEGPHAQDEVTLP